MIWGVVAEWKKEIVGWIEIYGGDECSGRSGVSVRLLGRDYEIRAFRTNFTLRAVRGGFATVLVLSAPCWSLRVEPEGSARQPAAP